MGDQLQDIKERASVAELHCPECRHTIGFDDFLNNHEERIDEDAGSIEFGCVACGNDTVEMRRRGDSRPIIVANGLEELERIAGE